MVALSQCIPTNVHPASDRQPLQISAPSEDPIQHSSHLQCSLPCCPPTSGLQSVTVLSIPAYQWLSQPICGCLIHLSLSVANTASQWLSHLSQPINGRLIYLSLSVAISFISAYKWLSHHLSPSVAVSSISAYQRLSQPIGGCLIYLSLSVASSASQWLSQPINGCLIYLSLSVAISSISAYQWLSHHLSLSVAISAYRRLSHLSQSISG